MIYPKIPLAQSIIEICRAKGIEHIVIAPGSRNAPLTIGFVSHPFFTCYSIADERCAAFFAMGIAQQIKKPVAVICTSGSAVLNFYPAVAEAFYSQIPLIIISADRPLNKIDIGDGQTIRQQNVLDNHTLFNANLSEEASTENDALINEAINVAISQSGPTHINVPFEEPLYETVTSLTATPLIVEREPLHTAFELNETSLQLWNTAVKKLILVGTLEPNSIEDDLLASLAYDPSVVVLTESTSNLHHSNFLSNIDTIITPFTVEDFKAFQPELLLTFGGMIVSKRIKSFLRTYQPRQHWHADTLRAYDTFGCLTEHFKVHPNTFLKQLLAQSQPKESHYQKNALQVQAVRKVKHQAYLAALPFCDFKVFEQINQAIPEGIQLQVSNSSSIRYMQLFDWSPSIDSFCNRGTSGIDGSTSTAIGAAVASKKPTVIITGDVSFFYDSNALWNNYIPSNFKIIVINNGGGGIFRILPGHQENTIFNTYFETSHCLTAESLAKMYRFKYRMASTEATLTNELKAFFNESEQPQILEIFTPTLENDGWLKNYFKELV
jgi:2-succinyl-5-enolpyruvyl-6-hydroxy-3-cyclohexene-1-carboxylate synthase